MFHQRCSETGYYDPDEGLEAAHEAAEERYQQEILASHGCAFDDAPKPMAAASEFYRDLAVELAKEVA